VSSVAFKFAHSLPFWAATRERFQASPNPSLLPLLDFPKHQQLYLGLNQAARDPVLSSLAGNYRKLQMNQMRVSPSDLQAITRTLLSDQHFQALKIKVGFLTARSLLRMFCCSKASISSTPSRGWDRHPDTPQCSVPTLAFKDQLVETSEAPALT